MPLLSRVTRWSIGGEVSRDRSVRGPPNLASGPAGPAFAAPAPTQPLLLGLAALLYPPFLSTLYRRS